MVNLSAEKCCGCMACYHVCPVDAIDVVVDAKDNDFVRVDTNKCINCNKCERVCPIISPVKLSRPKRVYAAVAQNNSTTNNSSSGGAAYIIATKIIEKGGVVYGCASTSLSTVEHTAVEDIQFLDSLAGSKYVKSDISKVLPKIKQSLQDGRKVVFFGTSCQVAAVIKYVGNHEQLLCVDLVCHGEPSIKFLERYVSETVGDNVDSKANLRIQFRWKTPKIQFGTRFVDVTDSSIVISQPYPKSPYMAAFFSGICYRENCHNCIFARRERGSDITLGDFWGVKSSLFNADEGVSLVMCNTTKGQLLFDEVSHLMTTEEHSLEDAVAHNANLSAPKKRPYNKDQFYHDMQNHTIEYSIKKNLPSYRKENNPIYRLYLKVAKFAYKLLK